MTDRPSYGELEARVRELETDLADYKRQAHVLKNKRVLMSKIIDDGVVGFYRSTPEGRFIWLNDAFAHILGYHSSGDALAEISDIQNQCFVNGSDRARFMETLLQKGEIGNFECEVRQEGGTRVWVSENARSILDENGDIIGYEGMVVDITLRKQSEQAKEDAENFLALLINTLPVPVFYKDRSGRYLGFNTAFESFFGEEREELIGRTVLDISPKELAHIYCDKDEALFKSGGTQRYESRVQNARGEMREVIFYKSVYRDKEDGIAGLIGTILDITERKAFERAISESEERFREMAELLPGAVVETDIDINVTYVNRHGLKMFALEENDVADGLNGLALIHPEERERAARRIMERLSRQSLLPTEYRMLTKDGRTIWVYLNAAPIFRDDEAIGFRIVLSDISEHKQAEKDRERLIRELKEALSEIRTLKGIVPICAKCKKIRDDKGYWNKLESFIQKHSHASFSHSLCPDCSDALYGKERWYQELKRKKGK